MKHCRKSRYRILTALLMLGIIGPLEAVQADEVDDALGIERATNGQSRRTAKRRTTRSPRTKTRKSATTSQHTFKSPSTGQVAAFMRALEKKEVELLEAKMEVTKLKGVIRRMWEANRREQMIMHYNMGCAYKQAGNYRESESQFLKALEKSPDDPDVHYNLAILYDDDLRDIRKARRHYKRFLELSPGDKDASKVLEWLASLH